MTTPTPPQPPSQGPRPPMENRPDLPTIYANFVRIAHSPADFVFDFAHLLPGEQQAKVRVRVLMSPLSAKLLLRALSENIARYEAAFGEINVPVNSSLAEHLFKPFHPPEPPQENK